MKQYSKFVEDCRKNNMSLSDIPTIADWKHMCKPATCEAYELAEDIDLEDPECTACTIPVEKRNCELCATGIGDIPPGVGVEDNTGCYPAEGPEDYKLMHHQE